MQGIPEAVRDSSARVVYVTNLMTKPGETDGLTAEDFVREVNRYLGSSDRLDAVVVNSAPFTERTVSRYTQMGASPVQYDMAALGKLALEVIESDLVAEGVFVRHDPDKLAGTVLSLVPSYTGAAWQGDSAAG